VLTQPRNADERMTFGRAVFRVWMALVIHVVEQANRLPQVRVGAIFFAKYFIESATA
jgi:hypothetical protein